MPAGDGIRAGKAYIELSLKDSAIGAQLDGVKRKFNAVGRSLRNFGTTALGAGTAIAGAMALPIQAASEAQETMSKFSVVFGDIEDDALRFSNNLADTLKRSKYDIAANMASFQDLFVPMGMAANDAFEMSKTMTKLAEDLASFNNLDTADVIRDLQAAMTGSGETMKKYGVILTEAAIKDKLAEMGLEATEVNKALARQEIILGATTAAQGDAERTSGSFANQMKALKAAIDETMVAIGDHLLPIVTPLVEKLAGAVKVVGEWAQQNAEVAQGILIAGGLLAAVGAVGTALGIVVGGITTLIGSPIVATIAAIAAVAATATVAFSEWAEAIKSVTYELLAVDSTKDSNFNMTPMEQGVNAGVRTSGTLGVGMWLMDWLRSRNDSASTIPSDSSASATPKALGDLADLAKRSLAEQKRTNDLLNNSDGLVFG